MEWAEFSSWDLGWIAVDRSEYVAVFTTGGAGPVPPAVIATPLDSVGRVEEAVLALPVVSDHGLLARVPRPDDFIEFATRGVFSHDWTDVHRRSSEELRAYELQAWPHQPRRLHDLSLPDEVRRLALRCNVGVDFPAALSIGQSLIEAPVDA